MRTFLLFILLASVFSSCETKSGTNEEENKEFSSSTYFGEKDYLLPTLTPATQELVRQWQTLEDLLNQAKNLNGSSHSELRNGSEIMRRSADSLMATIPAVFDTNIIKSRLLVVQTRAELIYQAAHADTRDSLAIQNSITEMNHAIKNLILQLNEKLEKDLIDIQRTEDENAEFKKQQRFRDSVFSAEFQDKQRPH
ncbi:MAG TPA: hypothetical protein VFF21_04875 [Flavobacteriaceae bacterium]|nr:hypothetical protein [Flavobacteriaceae bacterium]